MMDTEIEGSHRFVLQALDPDQGIVVLEAVFDVDALGDLRALLGPEGQSDPELYQLYYPTAEALAAIIARFDVPFDPGEWRVRLHNLEIRGQLPYRVHSGYELPMLLDGTKQFGFVDHVYPPHRHDEEDLFDHYVAQGELYKEVVVEPFDRPFEKRMAASWRATVASTTPARARNGGLLLGG